MFVGGSDSCTNTLLITVRMSVVSCSGTLRQSGIGKVQAARNNVKPIALENRPAFFARTLK